MAVPIVTADAQFVLGERKKNNTPQTTLHYFFATVATSSATRAWRNRIIWRKYGKIALILEDMDHIDEAEEYKKGVGIIAY